MTIGEKIKYFRKMKKMKQQELAEKIGKTESSIRKYEADLVAIPLNVLEQIASALGISVFNLIGFDLSSISTDCLLAELKRRCENGG